MSRCRFREHQVTTDRALRSAHALGERSTDHRDRRSARPVSQRDVATLHHRHAERRQETLIDLMDAHGNAVRALDGIESVVADAGAFRVPGRKGRKHEARVGNARVRRHGAAQAVEELVTRRGRAGIRAAERHGQAHDALTPISHVDRRQAFVRAQQQPAGDEERQRERHFCGDQCPANPSLRRAANSAAAAFLHHFARSHGLARPARTGTAPARRDDTASAPNATANVQARGSSSR